MISYKRDEAGTRELMNGPEMQAVMRQVADEAMPRAVALAPVRTGEYKSSFSVLVHEGGGIHHDRAEALIINDSAHAVLVEDWDEFHTMRDAAEALGGLSG